jgi:hypothetical protein
MLLCSSLHDCNSCDRCSITPAVAQDGRDDGPFSERSPAFVVLPWVAGGDGALLSHRKAYG